MRHELLRTRVELDAGLSVFFSPESAGLFVFGLTSFLDFALLFGERVAVFGDGYSPLNSVGWFNPLRRPAVRQFAWWRRSLK